MSPLLHFDKKFALKQGIWTIKEILKLNKKLLAVPIPYLLGETAHRLEMEKNWDRSSFPTFKALTQTFTQNIKKSMQKSMFNGM